MPINEFRNRIRINKYILGQNAIGGNVKDLTSYFDLWAKIENLNGGSRMLDNLGITYTKAYKITTRYEISRPIIASDEIVYKGLTFSLTQTPTQIEEGKNSFNVMIAYTNGTESNTGDIITGPGKGELITNEVPAGLINGSNATFTTEFEFVPESVSITVNGLEQKSPEDYTTIGTTAIVFTSSPETGDQILIDYIKAF